MSYCTQADIITEISETSLVELTDDSGAGVVDAAMVTAAIANADELIDGYLRSRYTVPLATVTGLIKKLSVDLAVYELSARREHFAEIRQLKRDAAIALLKSIASKQISLGLDESAAATGAGSPQTTTDPDDRIFTSGTGGTLENF